MGAKRVGLYSKHTEKRDHLDNDPPFVLTRPGPAKGLPAVVLSNRKGSKAIGRFGPAAKERAFQLYFEGRTRKAIAAAIGCTVDTIDRWKEAGRWREREREYTEELRERWHNRVIRLQADKAPEVIERHLTLTKDLDAEIGKVLKHAREKLPDTGLEPEQLSDLSKALKNSADVSTRASGINRDGQVGGQQKSSPQIDARRIYYNLTPSDRPQLDDGGDSPEPIDVPCNPIDQLPEHSSAAG